MPIVTSTTTLHGIKINALPLERVFLANLLNIKEGYLRVDGS